MGQRYLDDVQVIAFTDHNGKQWKHVKLLEIHATDGVVDEKALAWFHRTTGWLCEDGTLVTGSLYSGGATGAGYNGGTSPTKDNPEFYGENKQYSRWYEEDKA